MAAPRTRQAHASETRELILTTAERLFAEHGMAAVSNRQIGEAAGQANNFAVGYHFGSKADLVLAIVRRHSPAIEQRRIDMLAAVAKSSELRDWLACLVLPLTEHIAALGSPGWYARFIAQATTDPAMRRIVVEETVASPSMGAVSEGLRGVVPVLPADVVAERSDMSRHLIVHVCAERERALHEATATPRATWDGAAAGLIDALAGLWRAPFTPTD